MTNVATSLSFVNQRLEKIPEIKERVVLLRLDISENPIKNFEGMSTKYSVESIVANNTKIISFEGIVPQQNLVSISATGSPLGGNPCFPIMSLILFGDSLTSVNGKRVALQERKLANFLKMYVIDDLIEGWVLTSTTPTVILINPVTRKRKMVVVDAIEDQKQEDLSDEEEEQEKIEEEEIEEVAEEVNDELRRKFHEKRDDLNRRCRSKTDVKMTKPQKNTTNDQSIRQFMRSKPTTNAYPTKNRLFEKRNSMTLRPGVDECTDENIHE